MVQDLKVSFMKKSLTLTEKKRLDILAAAQEEFKEKIVVDVTFV